MATLEMVEKLRERANVTFDEAKEALELNNNDVLDALIYLEKQGKVEPPNGGGFYTNQAEYDKWYRNYGSDTRNSHYDRRKRRPARGRRKRMEQDVYEEGRFGTVAKKFASFLGKALHVGNRTMIEIFKSDTRIMSVPLTVVVLLCIFLFPYTLIGIVVSLFFGIRYRVGGAVLDNNPVNSAIDAVANAAEKLKESIKNS